MFKVRWESMFMIWLVADILLFRKLCNGFGLTLNLERELSQECDRKSIKISISKFVQEMEPIAVLNHVKDDLEAPLAANVHSQFRGSVSFSGCSCKEIHSCRLPLEPCKAGPRLPKVMIS